MHRKARIRFGFSYSDHGKSKTCTERSRSTQNLKWLRISLIAFVLVMAGAVAVAEARQAKHIPRIGYLTGSPLPSNRAAAFQQGLRELGYVEGKNIVIEWRTHEGNRVRRRSLAAELANLKVDVIVAVGSGDIRAAKEATATIPIVMVQGGDVVRSGFVASLARPGGNITGLATPRPELGAKRLELLKEIVPGITRVAVFVHSTDRDYTQFHKELERAAKSLKVKLQYLDIRTANDIETAFQAAAKKRADAILFRVAGPIAYPHRARIAKLALKNRFPGIYERASQVEAGGLMCYGADFNELYRHAATYVDKILKGAKPADLPVQQATKFEFIINLKAAKQIGLIIPPNVLARADKVIR